MRLRIFILTLLSLYSFNTIAQVSLADKFYKRGHEIKSTAISPDSKVYATGGTDRNIILWDVRTGRILQELDENDIAQALVFSPDGKYLISGGQRRTVNIWDWQSGEKINTLKGHRNEIFALAVSPDGATIASGSTDRLIKLWDLQSGEFLKDLKGHRGYITSLDFHPSGNKIVSASSDETIKEWALPGGFEISNVRAHRGWVRAVRYSPDGKYIATAGDDHKIKIWNNGKMHHYLKGHKDIVHSLTYSHDGKYLISGSQDRFFYIWNIQNGNIVYTSEPQKNIVQVTAITPDGKNIITADNTFNLSIWDISSLGVPEQSQEVSFMADNTVKEIKEVKEPITEVKAESQEESVEEKTTLPVNKATPTPGIEKVEDKTVDVDILTGNPAPLNNNRYALIVGNEDYSSHQKSLRTESNVDFAIKDAEMFHKYARHYLGIPEENIILLKNAKAIEMHRAINKINMITGITKGKAEVFFYYAGHGFPDEQTKDPYLMPVDVSGADLEFALPLKEIYDKFTEYPTQKVTVFLDACFSGGARNQGLVAARGVKVVPKTNIISGNMVVFTASSDDQSSLPYHEKGHGIFTYFLLKKIQETQGYVSYRELSDYLKEQVAIKSVMINNKKQIPETNISVDLQDTWHSMYLNK